MAVLLESYVIACISIFLLSDKFSIHVLCFLVF